MSPVAAIILSVVAFAIIVGFTILILVVAMRDKPNNTWDQDNTVVNTPTASRINWTENTRGFQSSNFPPCYEQSGEVRKVYAILKANNLEKKYMQLLDVYSILLCQYTQTESRPCSESYINDRLADLNAFGGDANNQRAQGIVKSITQLSNNKVGKMLVMATDLIERQIESLKKEKDITTSDIEQIVGLNSMFYRQRYDLINKHCQ